MHLHPSGTKPVDFITIPIMMIRVNEKALISTENIKTSLSTPEAGFSHMKGNGSRQFLRKIYFLKNFFCPGKITYILFSVCIASKHNLYPIFYTQFQDLYIIFICLNTKSP